MLSGINAEQGSGSRKRDPLPCYLPVSLPVAVVFIPFFTCIWYTVFHKPMNRLANQRAVKGETMTGPLQKNEIIELNITGMSHEGNGVGRYEDFVLFVPMTAPGDRILCRVVKVNKNFGYGRVEQLL